MSLLNFLFLESQSDHDSEACAEEMLEKLFEALEEVEDLDVDAKALAKALSKIGIEDVDLCVDDDESCVGEVKTPAGSGVLDKLADPDNMHTLATLGWVASPTGDGSVKFIRITTSEADGEEKPEPDDDVDKILAASADVEQSASSEANEEKAEVTESVEDYVNRLLL